MKKFVVLLVGSLLLIAGAFGQPLPVQTKTVDPNNLPVWPINQYGEPLLLDYTNGRLMTESSAMGAIGTYNAGGGGATGPLPLQTLTVDPNALPVYSGGVYGYPLLIDKNNGKLIVESSSGSGLPDQTGNAGKYLTTDGTNASWAVVAGTGTVTNLSIVSANGFAGTVATSTTTPAITISTTITGILKGNGTAIAAASAGTDYEVPITFSTGLTRTVNTVTVNTTQNILKISGLTSNGLVTTSGGDGTLGVTIPGTGVLTALAVNVGSAGAFVTFNGAGGTPSALTLTNATGLPIAGLTAASQAQGDVIYYNGTNWVRLAAGTNGNFLQTQGAGANVQWAAGGAGTISSGTTNRIPKYTAATTIGNSLLSDDGTTLTYTGSGGINAAGSATGIITITGLTSGSFKLTGADAMAQILTLSVAAQTSGAATATIPDLAGVSQTISFIGKAETLSGAKTFSGGVLASGANANDFSGGSGTFKTSTGLNTIGGAATFNSTITLGGTALSFGALPSGATTTGTLGTFSAQTYTVTGTNTATAFQGLYHGVVTVTDASAGTVTDLFSENWAGPAVGAGSLIVTRGHTLGILDSTSAASSITGAFIIATTYGTSATSIGMGGGNLNAGGNGTFGGTLSVTGALTFTAGLGSTTATTQSAGDASTKVSTTAYADRDSQLQYNAQTGTTYTLVLADGTPGSATAGVSMSNAASNTLTVPTNASVAFPVGWTIPILNLGVGATTIAAAGGVTINAPGGLLTIGTTNGSGVLNKTATNTWQWYGASLPAVVASGRVTAQSAANASIATFTVGAADSSFNVSANMEVSASTTLVTTLTCTYTDESNTARSMIFPVQQVSGSFIAAGAITGTGAWETPVMHIRCKAATAITILTSTGTFTGITYTAEGVITQTR